MVPKAVPALTTVLGDEWTEARKAAAEALGKMGEAARSAIPALERAARDKDDSVAGAARDALEKIKTASGSKISAKGCR